MTVAVAHPTYWPEVRRGAERLAHDVAGALGATIVTTHRERTDRAPDAVRLWRPPAQRLERRLFEPYLETIPLMARELRRYDAVLALHITSAEAARRAQRPTVYWHMGVPHRAWVVARRGRRTLIQRAVQSDHVLALSRFAADAFDTWLGVQAQVVYPPVDTERFSRGGTRAEHPTIVCAADAREPRKRVGDLVTAFTGVRREHPQARLLLDARTATHRAPGVELVDMTDLPAVYREAWVSALPSWGEAFGLVLAEALACGTPVVGANREGIPEVIGDAPVGILDDGDLTHALLDAIELAQDPKTAAACRKRAETFSISACADRLRPFLK